MFGWLADLLSWLVSFWRKLPDETKAEIISASVDELDRILREYYRRYEGEAT